MLNTQVNVFPTLMDTTGNILKAPAELLEHIPNMRSVKKLQKPVPLELACLPVKCPFLNGVF
jgi:hypothetical protein